MDEVFYQKAWEWTCPECNEWNTEDTDPDLAVLVTCAACGKHFYPKESGI